TILNQSNSGGYSVFGKVMGTGMTIIDQMAAQPRFNAGSAFTELPLRNYTTGNPTEANLLVVNAVRPVGLFPTGSGDSVLTITVENSATSIVSSVVSGSNLRLTPLAPGSASVPVH